MVEERADRVEQEPNALAVENFQWAKFPNRSNLLEMDWLFAHLKSAFAQREGAVAVLSRRLFLPKIFDRLRRHRFALDQLDFRYHPSPGS